MAKQDFMELVQLHERGWGLDTYPGRPKLDAILKAWIVAFWYPTKRRDHGYLISVHETIDELENYAANLLLNSSRPLIDRRLAYLFVDKKEIKIKGVKLIFEMKTGAKS